jgi:hypothetical protein
MGKVQPMDPQSVFDFVHDWSDWLTGSEVISTSTWSISPSGSLAVDSESETTTTATVFVSGGVAGNRYRVINHIVTDAGRECDRTITVRIGQR